MIITGADVLAQPQRQLEASLDQITELVRLVRPVEARPLTALHLSAIGISGLALFYRVEERIVGCAHLTISPHMMGVYRGSIESVAVHTDCRRCGYATVLVGGLIEYAKARQLVRVALLVDEGNDAAHLLYDRMGFERVDRQQYRFYL